MNVENLPTDSHKNNTEKVKIICKKHGVFETRANNHISKLKEAVLIVE